MKERFSYIFGPYRYGIAIFGILLIYMFSHPQYELDADCVCAYIIGYDTGFGGRKLLASLLKFVWPVMNMGHIMHFAYAVAVALCALFSYLCNKFILKMKEKGEDSYFSALYLIALYLLCPAAIIFLLRDPNLGRLDTFFYGASLLLCFLFHFRNRNRTLYYFLIFVLIGTAILLHHIFVSTYLTFFIALFIYDIWGNGFHRKRFFLYTLVGILCIAIFLGVLFGSSMNISLDEAVASSPYVPLSRKFVCFGYYAHISDHIQQYILPKLPRLLIGFPLTVLFLFPLFYALYFLWKQLYHNLSTQYDRRLLLGILSSFLLFVPAFCITVDYSRWFGAFIFLQFLLIAYFCYEDDTPYAAIRSILAQNLRRHLGFAVLLLIYCSIFEYFYADNFLDCIEIIMNKLHIHRATTLLPPAFR